MYTPFDEKRDPKQDPSKAPTHPAPLHPAPVPPMEGAPDAGIAASVILPTTDADFTADLEVDFVPMSPALEIELVLVPKLPEAA